MLGWTSFAGFGVVASSPYHLGMEAVGRRPCTAVGVEEREHQLLDHGILSRSADFGRPGQLARTHIGY